MPIITVQMFEGRSREDKQALITSLTDAACESLGCQPAAISVVLQESPRENWFTGGKLWAE